MRYVWLCVYLKVYLIALFVWNWVQNCIRFSPTFRSYSSYVAITVTCTNVLIYYNQRNDDYFSFRRIFYTRIRLRSFDFSFWWLAIHSRQVNTYYIYTLLHGWKELMAIDVYFQSKTAEFSILFSFFLFCLFSDGLFVVSISSGIKLSLCSSCGTIECSFLSCNRNCFFKTNFCFITR